MIMRFKSWGLAMFAALGIREAAFAAPYVLVHADADNALVLDRGALKPSEASQATWSHLIFVNALADGTASISIRREYDCAAQKSRVMISQSYDAKGGAIFTNDRPSDWKSVQPKTPGAIELREVCSPTPLGRLIDDAPSVDALIAGIRQKMSTADYRSIFR